MQDYKFPSTIVTICDILVYRQTDAQQATLLQPAELKTVPKSHFINVRQNVKMTKRKADGILSGMDRRREQHSTELIIGRSDAMTAIANTGP